MDDHAPTAGVPHSRGSAATPTILLVTKTLRRLLLAVFMIAAVVVTAEAPAPVDAAAPSPIHPDNRPSTVPGATNGQFDASILLQVAPTCVAYYRAAPSLISMMAAARRDGIRLLPADCYRDYAGQVAMREMWCGRGACHMAAVPGTSNHGWGKAVDFGDMTFDSAAYHWLKAHAGEFGWNHPGVMEPGGSVPEPWHWEWVGDGGRMFPGSSHGFGNGLGLVVNGGHPAGHLDAAVGRESVNGWLGDFHASGWVIDPDTTNSIDVHMYVDGKGAAALRANKPRADVAELLAGYAAAPHGFEGDLTALYGRREVCAYGINTAGPGQNTLLNCVIATIGQHPIGSIDSTFVGTGTAVRGWALDANSTGAIDVHAYVDGQYAGAVTANRNRPDVDAVFPRNGKSHGFEVTVPTRHGTQTVCLYGINAGPGGNNLIGCNTVTSDRHPFGFLDSVRAAPGGLTVNGWVIDPDTTGPVEVHTYIDGRFAGLTMAGVNRPDIAAAFPQYGAGHGFSATYAAAPGAHTVCTYGINVGAGATGLIECKALAI